ncbi:MAG: hypothetical protein CMO44_18660 [Verrucomicrobiales bacterium]|nr:hypothetical protein [Verrucomicrobiales bacterium]
MTEFPLPLSNNWRVFGLPIVNGALAGNIVLFPGEFKKENQEFGPRHVFILQDKNRQYNFVYWEYNKKQPTLIPENIWNKCFHKDKITKFSNRYYIHARGRDIILPYMPDILHQRLIQSKQFNNLDLTYTNALFQHLIEPMFQEHANRALTREPFTGWKKDLITNTKYHSYKDILMKQKKKYEPVIDLDVPFEKLDKKQKEQIKQAFNIIHTIFPNFVTSI